MAFMAFLWFYMAFYGFIWQNNVFSRSHRSKFIQEFITLSVFLPQAMLKGPIRSFVVVDLVVGVESSSKNVPNRTTNVQGNKKCAREQKMYRQNMALHGLFMVSYGIFWSFLAVIDPN